MPVFTMGELLRRQDRVEYLLPPFLTKGGVMLMAAPKKSMKTFLGLHMATAIASGRPFIDMPTIQQRVLYIDFEIGIGEAKKRMQPMRDHYGETDDLLLRTRDEHNISLDPGTVGTSNLFDMLDKVRPGVVFVDTLRRVHGGDENSSEHMAKVFGRLQELSIKFDFTSVVIHHMGKEPAEESSAPRTSRGSSVIEDFPDTLGYITKHVTSHLEDPRISIRWDFRNHAPIEPSKFVYNRLTGLFERWHKTSAKEKHEQQEHVENLSGADAENLAAGLLQPV